MTSLSHRSFWGPLFAALCLSSAAHAVEIRIEIGKVRAPNAWGNIADSGVREFAKRAAKLSTGLRDSLRKANVLRTPMFLPTRVVLTDSGRPLSSQTKGPGDIVPTFDGTGSRAFSTDYKTYLQQVFTAAQPAMDAVFGKPASGGVVHILNYDADIQDRYAVAGGYYLPNAPQGAEVRFPVYNNRVAAAINYIHTLLLAYLGSKQYSFDAYDEGLVRAATILVARTPGSIPDNPSSDQIEAVLSGLYDVGPVYDWFNHPGLGSPKFIAPNLLNTALPFGGSTGGVFLLRYQMAGTAWAKVATRYPGFIAEFNKRYFLNPSAYVTSAQLETLGQQVLDFISGSASTKIEGFSFSDWALRQAALDVRLSPGLKLLPAPVAIPAIQGSSDFGAFDIVLNAFETKANGDEILLAGTAFPIYWRPDFTRFFTLPQDDVLKIAGAYGSVTPNFPAETFASKPYRVTVDLPFNGKNVRVQLPAGAVSTAANTTVKSFYGTIQGLAAPGVTPYSVKVSWVGGAKAGIAVTNNAFGFDITDPNFLKSGPVTIQVFQGSVEKIHREVVKTVGSLALDLYPSESEVLYSFTRPNRLEFIGLPIEPYRPNAADILGLTSGQVLLARWDSTVGRYRTWPEEGEIKQGLGYWVRPPSSLARTVQGKSIPGMPVAVALNPGWNQITLPLQTSVTTANIFVTVGTEAIGTYEQAVTDGTLGTTIYQFVGDSQNADAGTMTPVLSLLPGKAYFVRANRADGAVLLFVPAGGTRMPDGGGSGRKPPHYTMVWETYLTLTEERGKSSKISVGQAMNARRLFDLALDNDLPPLQAGFQMAVMNGFAMTRDIRSQGTLENYVIKMKGLVVGKKYTLNFHPTGQAPLMKFSDGLRVMGVTNDDGYSFVASAKERTVKFEIWSRD